MLQEFESNPHHTSVQSRQPDQLSGFYAESARINNTQRLVLSESDKPDYSWKSQNDKHTRGQPKLSIVIPEEACNTPSHFNEDSALAQSVDALSFPAENLTVGVAKIDVIDQLGDSMFDSLGFSQDLLSGLSPKEMKMLFKKSHYSTIGSTERGDRELDEKCDSSVNGSIFTFPREKFSQCAQQQQKVSSRVLGDVSNKNAPSSIKRVSSLKVPIPSIIGEINDAISSMKSTETSIVKKDPIQKCGDVSTGLTNSQALDDIHLFFQQPLSLTVNAGVVKYDKNVDLVQPLSLTEKAFMGNTRPQTAKQVALKKAGPVKNVKSNSKSAQLLFQEKIEAVNSGHMSAQSLIPSWLIPSADTQTSDIEYVDSAPVVWTSDRLGSTDASYVHEIGSGPESYQTSSDLNSSSGALSSTGLASASFLTNSASTEEEESQSDAPSLLEPVAEAEIDESPKKSRNTVKFAISDEEFDDDLNYVPKKASVTCRPKSSSKMFTMSLRDKPYSPPKPSWYKASYASAVVKAPPVEPEFLDLAEFSKSAGGMPVTSIYLRQEKEVEKALVAAKADGKVEVEVKVDSNTPEDPDFGNWKDKYTAQVQQNFAGCFNDIDDFIQEFDAKTDVILEHAVAAATAISTASASTPKSWSENAYSKGLGSHSHVSYSKEENASYSTSSDEEDLIYTEPNIDEEVFKEAIRPSTARSKAKVLKLDPTPDDIDEIIEDLAYQASTFRSSVSLKGRPTSVHQSQLAEVAMPADIELRSSGKRFGGLFKKMKLHVKRRFGKEIVS